MHRSEAGELVDCAVCGATVDVRGGRAYVFGGGGALCFECAVGRGGSFDAAQDRWVEAPRISDLPRDDG
jgi:hypothetical protein